MTVRRTIDTPSGRDGVFRSDSTRDRPNVRPDVIARHGLSEITVKAPAPRARTSIECRVALVYERGGGRRIGGGGCASIRKEGPLIYTVCFMSGVPLTAAV